MSTVESAVAVVRKARSAGACQNLAAILGISNVLFWIAPDALAQAPASDPSAQHATADVPAHQNKQLTDQITDLRAQVAKLQAAVQQTEHGKKVSPRPGMKMTPAVRGMGMDENSEMGMPPAKAAVTSGVPPRSMKDDGGEMGGMPPAGKAMSPATGMGDDKMSGSPMGGKDSGSSAPDPAMGMCCMEKMTPGGKPTMSTMPPAASGMAPMPNASSAKTGQAGASNFYHIGSNGFFLNQSKRITLTSDQKLTLNHLKDRALLDRAFQQRKMEEAEQQLFTLTGAAQPDNAGIQTKIAEIEKLRADERMNFIRAVGEASNVLTPEQHKALLGT